MNLYELFFDKMQSLTMEGEEQEHYFQAAVRRFIAEAQVEAELDDSGLSSCDASHRADRNNSQALRSFKQTMSREAHGSPPQADGGDNSKEQAARAVAEQHISTMNTSQYLSLLLTLAAKLSLQYAERYTSKRMRIDLCLATAKKRQLKRLRIAGEDPLDEYQDCCKTLEDNCTAIQQNLTNRFVRMNALLCLQHPLTTVLQMAPLINEVLANKHAVCSSLPEPLLVFADYLHQREAQFTRFGSRWEAMDGDFATYLRASPGVDGAETPPLGSPRSTDAHPGEAASPSMSTRRPELARALSEFSQSLTPTRSALYSLLERQVHERPTDFSPLLPAPSTGLTTVQKQCLMEHTVYPQVVIPERTRLCDANQRITPFCSHEEVMRILRWLGAHQTELNWEHFRLFTDNAEGDRDVNSGANSAATSATEVTEESTDLPLDTEDETGSSATLNLEETVHAPPESVSGEDATDVGDPSQLPYITPQAGTLTLLHQQHILRLRLANPLPLCPWIVATFQCDMCGLPNLRVAFQAITYKAVRKDVHFFDGHFGYDVCTACAVFFVKSAVLRLVRAVHPSPLVRVPARHGDHCQVAISSITCDPVTTPGDSGEVRIVVGVSPYGARPCAWAVTHSQLQHLASAWQPQQPGESADPEAPCFPLNCELTDARMDAIPTPPSDWGALCSSTALKTENDGRRTLGDADLCPICLGDLQSPAPILRTLCRHWFHVDCIAEVHVMNHRTSETSDTDQDPGDPEGASHTRDCCPVCRAPKYMPPTGVDYAVQHNRFELKLHTLAEPAVPGNGATCQYIVIATLLSDDGAYHNATNVSSCQLLCIHPDTAPKVTQCVAGRGS